MDEIAGHYGDGRSTLIYQHFGRGKAWRAFMGGTAAWLRSCLTNALVWAFETSHVVFLLAAKPEHAQRAEKVAKAVAARGWLPQFFTAAARKKRSNCEA